MKRLELNGVLEEVQIGSTTDQTTWTNKNLQTSLRKGLLTLLKRNVELLAWIATDIPRIDLEIMCHRLVVCLKVRPMAQKGRKMSLDKALEVQK